MAALPSVAAIVNGANLDPKNIPQVETLFEQFTNLSPTERDNERGSFMEKVNLSEDKLTADIGVGLRWLDVYKALDQYDLAVSNYEVVLANAEIVNANVKENSDLFWALKGAGGNFDSGKGIVTKIEMKTVPAKVWSEAKLYAPSVTSELSQALMKHHEAIESDEKSSLLLTCNNQGSALVSFYCDAVDKLPAVFEPFEHIPATSQSLPRGVYSTYELLGVIEDLAVPGHVWFVFVWLVFPEENANYQSHNFRTMSSQPSLEVFETAERVRVEQSDLLSDVEGLRIKNVIQPMSSISIKQSRKVGGNPLGLEEVGQQWFLVMADWNNPADGDRVRQAMRHIVDVAEATAKANGTYLPYQYCNYASLDQDSLVSYGADNLEKLRAIASKYDPDGVFQTLQSAGWLLSRVGSTE
ncbi:hypothetical protein G4B84_000484 [Aspergillus flavus NRRL3357]|nr:uncharacterized protein G4B84_000484 [Aspergillus flavus NRRL3357]QMW25239.1 hypothetical protein G4B84_000484 [Aspergillus flavus NRRL3357]QMW37300.1 hypothetical protein G4B11_000536 [Aspergillus flavus]